MYYNEDLQFDTWIEWSTCNTVVDERVNDAEKMYQVESNVWTCNVSHDNDAQTNEPVWSLVLPGSGWSSLDYF